MLSIIYFHWHAADAEERRKRLAAEGFQVDVITAEVAGMRTALRASPPDAVVIDLSRLPSHGREIGVWLTETKSTGLIPVIFVDGAPDKIEQTRARIPSARYCSWKSLAATIKSACAVPVERRPKPQKVVASGPATAAGYSGTPLWKKLGIRAGASVTVLDEPDGFRELLTGLPDGVTFRTSLRGGSDLLIWFPADLAAFRKRLRLIADRTPERGIWIAWPKLTSDIDSDLSQNPIREHALAAGLVDFKVCAIDERYSGLQFARSRDRGKRHTRMS